MQNFKHFSKIIALAIITVFAVACDSKSTSTIEGRITKNLNEDWQYLENNTMSLSTAKEMDDWENVTLPHSWNALDATDVEAGYRRDASWYKKTLTVDDINDNAIYQLYFEGVNIVSTVYVNGKEVGGHIGGYIG